MDYEGLIDDNRVLISLIACSINYEIAVTFTYGHFKVVFAVYYDQSASSGSRLYQRLVTAVS